MVAQEHRPLTVLGDRRRLAHDVDDRIAVLFGDRHEHAGHEREVKCHVTFVALAEVGAHVFGPLIRFGEQEAVGILRIEHGAQAFENVVRLGEVLVVRALAFAQVGDGVEPHAVDAEVEPEPHHVHDRIEHRRMIEVEIGLVAEEAVPIELLGDRIPGPIRGLGIGEDDARAAVALGRVAPDVPVAGGGSARCLAGSLEPRVRIRGVVDDELGDHTQPQAMRGFYEAAGIAQAAVERVDALVVGDVVAVVAQRRGIERQEPHG